MPSTTMTIGAIARIGTVCEQMIHGIRLRSSVRTCTMQHREQRCRAPRRGRSPMQRRRERHPAVVDQAARRDRRIAGHRLDELSSTIWCGAGSTGRSALQVPASRSRDAVGACPRARTRPRTSARVHDSAPPRTRARSAPRTTTQRPAAHRQRARCAPRAMPPSATRRVTRHRNARRAGPRGRGARSSRNSGVSRMSSVRSRGRSRSR